MEKKSQTGQGGSAPSKTVVINKRTIATASVIQKMTRLRFIVGLRFSDGALFSRIPDSILPSANDQDHLGTALDLGEKPVTLQRNNKIFSAGVKKVAHD